MRRSTERTRLNQAYMRVVTAFVADQWYRLTPMGGLSATTMEYRRGFERWMEGANSALAPATVDRSFKRAVVTAHALGDRGAAALLLEGRVARAPGVQTDRLCLPAIWYTR